MLGGLMRHALENPSDEPAILAHLTTHEAPDVARSAPEFSEWLANSRHAERDLGEFTLKCGIKVSPSLVGALRNQQPTAVEWRRIGPISHPGMDEIQWNVLPVTFNGHMLPKEQIAYYILTQFVENGHKQQVFAVEDATRFAEPGRFLYTCSERRTTPVPSVCEAEETVVTVLRNFFIDEAGEAKHGT